MWTWHPLDSRSGLLRHPSGLTLAVWAFPWGTEALWTWRGRAIPGAAPAQA